MLKIALIGNPNSGKTTLFNSLTGSNHHVGNWPGKTVQKKTGRVKIKDNEVEIIDLPGTYSLTAFSDEEKIARDFVIKNKPDFVIDIIDATNFQRNLYLAIELIEMGANLAIGINMDNLAQKKGILIDEKKLSELLQIPVFKVHATNKVNVTQFIENVIKSKQKPSVKFHYGNDIEKHLHILTDKIKNHSNVPRWHSLKIIEQDKSVRKEFKEFEHIFVETDEKLKMIYDKHYSTIIFDKRYGFISGLTKDTVQRKTATFSKSDFADKITMNQYLGIPFFLAVMYILFQLTFTLAEPFINIIEKILTFIADFLINLLSGSVPNWTLSFLTDGMISGVGSVMAFLPNIFILFLLISIMEDSGYMARVAYIMDRFMHKIGLHGKSFIPLVLGFGCNVPAIMSTRSLDNKKDRLLTILINPYISCSARLPVYILFVGIFFVKYQGLIIFSLYILGIIVAIMTGFILNKLFFKGLTSELIMELPAYRIPTIKGALIHTWDRSKEFLSKAGSLIFIFVIVIWFLSSLPLGVEYASEQSLIGYIGKAVAPIFQPLGFGNWQSAIALIFGIAAKEIVIGTFGTLLGGNIQDALPQLFTPLSALSFMVMTLIYIPCIATIAVIKRETGSYKWTIFSIIYSIAIAWLAAFLVYQGGLLL